MPSWLARLGALSKLQRDMSYMHVLWSGIFQQAYRILERFQCHRHESHVLQRCTLQSSHWIVGRSGSEGHELHVLWSGIFQQAYRILERFRCHRYEHHVLQRCTLQSSHWIVGRSGSEGHELHALGGGGAGDRTGIDLVTNSPPQQATYPAPLPNTQW